MLQACWNFFHCGFCSEDPLPTQFPGLPPSPLEIVEPLPFPQGLPSLILGCEGAEKVTCVHFQTFNKNAFNSCLLEYNLYPLTFCPTKILVNNI